MTFLNNFFIVFFGYLGELWFSLLLGFFLSGVISKFVPFKFVEKYLGGKGVQPILIACGVGTLLPVCCIGSLPLAVTLRQKGASLGSILAFLIATPATSVPALIVSWRLLGGEFTMLIFIGVVTLGLVVGFLGNLISGKSLSKSQGSCSHCAPTETSDEEKKSFSQKMKEALHYGFIVLPKEIGKEILIGLLVASFISVYEPISYFVRTYLSGLKGYLIILVVGLVTYACCTGSVPMVHALMNTGLTAGQALCYMISGPITSYSTLLVVKKEFGNKAFFTYLAVICIGSLLFGIGYDIWLQRLV